MPTLAVTLLEDRTTPAVYTLDPAFSGDGIAPPGPDAAPDRVVPLADGGVLGVGRSPGSLARYTAAGEVDAGFGSAGRVALSGQTLDAVEAADGTLYALQVVNTGAEGQQTVLVTHLTAAGRAVAGEASPAGEFGITAGTAVGGDLRPLAAGGVGAAVVLAGGIGSGPRTLTVALQTVTAAGAGLVVRGGPLAAGTVDYPESGPAVDVLATADGGAVLTTGISLVKATATGDPDRAFGLAGSYAPVGVTFAPTGLNPHSSLADGPNGSVVAVGARNGVAGNSQVVVRLTSAGRPDPAFGPDGTVTAGPVFDDQRAVAVAPDGTVYVVGNTVALVGPRGGSTVFGVAVTRVKPGGAADAVSGPFAQTANGSARATAAAVDSSGRLLLGGSLVQLRGPRPADPPAGPVARVLVADPPAPARQTAVVAGRSDGGRQTLSDAGAGPVLSADPLAGQADALRQNPGPDGAGTRSSAFNRPAAAALYAIGSGPGDGVVQAYGLTFRPFEPSYTGGVFIAAADLNGDGLPEVVVTPDAGGGPVVVVYDGAGLRFEADSYPAILGRVNGPRPILDLNGVNGAQIVRYYGIDDPNFRGGARVALGDVTGDGLPDVVVAAGLGGGPRVSVWEGQSVLRGFPTQIANFFAFEESVRDGAFVAAGDVTGDGVADLAFGGGPGGGPRVRVFDGAKAGFAGASSSAGVAALDPAAQVSDAFAYDEAQRGGVRVALADLDGDGRAELVAGSGSGQPGRVRVFNVAKSATTPTGDFEAFPGVALTDGVYVG